MVYLKILVLTPRLFMLTLDSQPRFLTHGYIQPYDLYIDLLMTSHVLTYALTHPLKHVCVYFV